MWHTRRKRTSRPDDRSQLVPAAATLGQTHHQMPQHASISCCDPRMGVWMDGRRTPLISAPGFTDYRPSPHAPPSRRDTGDPPTLSCTSREPTKERFAMVFCPGSPHIHRPYDHYKVIL
jgi:hypothetical protein